ncbi:hypothetical protein IMCC3317_19870 [Kordia antarctica]|uniref:Lipoprotein n=1 Tax=Kordia antarctica TaxID=1218801 RepID=A0A7L4ZL10_9FLAO|nr:hypothetical protein [Kordia antarctica]QHI36624.1 hypothetical protein IMCC3317_19870 [Kordia antarctica]
MRFSKNRIGAVLIILMLLFSCETKTHQTETKPEHTKKAAIILQEKQVDTVVSNQIQNKIIAPKGSQIFDESVKLRYLRTVNGYRLTAIKVDECEDSDDSIEVANSDKTISEITFKEDSFSITFSAVENCCSAFLCEAEIIDKATLNIIYHPFGRHCSCNCKFEMEYTFTFDDALEEIGQKRTVIKYVQFNNEPTSRVEFKNK